MYTYQHEHRVRYRECDPMGVVYHTHYLDYFEAARTEALRDLGVRYRDLERNGIIMPVVSATVDYKQSAEYDDVVIVEAQFPEMPEVRVPIDYVVRRAETDTLLATGHTDLCFMNAERRRPVRIPEPVREAFLPHLSASS
jgi:acyl-CoA thioester hydrolase